MQSFEARRLLRVENNEMAGGEHSSDHDSLNTNVVPAQDYRPSQPSLGEHDEDHAVPARKTNVKKHSIMATLHQLHYVKVERDRTLQSVPSPGIGHI